MGNGIGPLGSGVRPLFNFTMVAAFPTPNLYIVAGTASIGSVGTMTPVALRSNLGVVLDLVGYPGRDATGGSLLYWSPTRIYIYIYIYICEGLPLLMHSCEPGSQRFP
jgi:hypothetical protein